MWERWRCAECALGFRNSLARAAWPHSHERRCCARSAKRTASCVGWCRGSDFDRPRSTTAGPIALRGRRATDCSQMTTVAATARVRPCQMHAGRCVPGALRETLVQNQFGSSLAARSRGAPTAAFLSSRCGQGPVSRRLLEESIHGDGYVRKLRRRDRLTALENAQAAVAREIVDFHGSCLDVDERARVRSTSVTEGPRFRCQLARVSRDALAGDRRSQRGPGATAHRIAGRTMSVRVGSRSKGAHTGTA